MIDMYNLLTYYKCKLIEFNPHNFDIPDQYYTCPINIPHCQRVACHAEPGKNPQNNANDCFAIPGCCFDTKTYQYKYLLGDQEWPFKMQTRH